MIDRIIDRASDMPGAANEILQRGAWVDVSGQVRGDAVLPKGTVSLTLPFLPENELGSWSNQILRVDTPHLELLRLPDGKCFAVKEDRLTLEIGKPRIQESSIEEALIDYLRCRVVQRETRGERFRVW